MEKQFREVPQRLRELKSDAEEKLRPLKEEVKACNDNSSRAEKALEQLKELVDAREEAKGPFASYTGPGETEKQRKKEEAALQEGKDAASNVKLAATKTRKAAEAVKKTLAEMEKLSNTLVPSAIGFLNSPAFFNLPSKRYSVMEDLAVASTREGESIQAFVAEEKLSVKRAFDAAERAEKFANFLKVGLELAEKEFKEEFWESWS
ncbi:uncharacterized protein TM35_000122840 [Trypanosoma theileri]|uniref:Uncharacterized protein n=1 Tax=Trypanosoma theileri TaxID=67003 RepID=A0A1X0NZ79_9TRYP|nr:uncharacterized protein TM35_000122840 [Trypanosoma theileri]ORC89509.1 hypothetical protein TM35_000122840 [Trypanosoma theileri]